MRIILAHIGRRAEELRVNGPFGRQRAWVTALREGIRRRRDRGFVNVRDLMQRVTLEEHIAKADAYFSTAGWETSHARKPFADPAEAERLLCALSVLVHNLQLFPGVRVLDFGAGTCWSSLIFGYLGCEVVATDVSPNALRFGEERVRADPIGRTLPIAFVPFDGRRLPMDDGTFDRVVAIDALHHVFDVEASLKELARVLRPGGIAAFSEPGPLHSLSPQSQFEMKAHGVIENDIRIEEIESSARDAGFEIMRVAWFTPEAELLDVRDFRRVVERRASGRDARMLADAAAQGLANVRIFFLYKSGARTMTSLSRSGLVATLETQLRWDGHRLRGTVTATNAGHATWLPSGSGHGEVNVGIQLRDAEGTLHRDFARAPLSATPIAPGEKAFATIDIVCPRGSSITVDLVAEGVAWFASVGSATAGMALD